MDLVQTLIDRELLVSAHLHDLAGRLTVILGGVETAVDERRMEARFEELMNEVSELLHSAREPALGAPERATFRGEAVWVRGPVAALEHGLAGLPHRTVRVERGAEVLSWSIDGIPYVEAANHWNLPMVRGWLADGGPGFAGARMRIAARIVGASYSLPPEGGGECTATLRLPRG